jgi:hypothetical protein
MELVLSEQEARVLSELLENALPDLREEVYKTESYDLREQLKQREAIVRSLLERLRHRLQQPAAGA